MSVGTESSERFVSRIRPLRDARRWSAQRLADVTGLDRRVLSKIENGTRGIALDEAVTIAAGFDMTVAEMCQPGPITTRFEVSVD